MSKEEALTLTENLRSALVQSERFQVVSRADMQKILKEQEFQRSDACNDTQCLVEMGKALAVQKIVGGSAGQAGGVYSLTLRVVDVETGKIEATVFKDIENVRDLLSSIRDLGRQLADMYGR
ncbi:MAG: Curli production assembly/transport component CsgG [Verrucomicrobia bacterium ADurb.Bin118]|nr:MAG: Curli production assembly/transport component CsgG [Verrucomicrobia bacterium ADurb.Bin118]